MKKILLTIDVEALPARARRDHIDRLIYGKFGAESFGINRIFDLAEEQGATLTAFFDYGGYPRFGEAWLDVARYINDRGQDLELHLHPDFLGEAFWQKTGLAPEADLREMDNTQANALVEYIIDLQEKAVGKTPLAFRGGAYKINGPLLEELARHNIKYDSTYNPGRRAIGFNIGNSPPFNWACGITELPIPFLTNFLNYPRAMEFNFNNYYFHKFELQKCVQIMLDFLDRFTGEFPQALPVLVMHSWSFLKLNKGTGHYDEINHKAAEVFSAFCAAIKGKYKPVTCADLAAANFTGLFEVSYRNNMIAPLELNLPRSGKCPICGSDKYLEPLNSGKVKRYCKKCKSLERQRTFYKLLKFKDSGFDLKGKTILHISGANCEKAILGAIPEATVQAIDIREGPGIDMVGDICAMPQVPSRNFDVIVCSQVLPHVYDLKAALGELARVLKDDGILLQCNITDPDKATVETTDINKITAWYGMEAYEKHRIGSFREFGEYGLEDLFKPWFERDRFEIIDDVTGQKSFWNVWRKRAESEKRESFLGKIKKLFLARQAWRLAK